MIDEAKEEVGQLGLDPYDDFKEMTENVESDLIKCILDHEDFLESVSTDHPPQHKQLFCQICAFTYFLKVLTHPVLATFPSADIDLSDWFPIQQRRGSQNIGCKDHVLCHEWH